MMGRRILGAALALAFLATGCTKVSTGGTESGGRVNAWTQPHVLRYADAGDVSTLNPHLGQLNDINWIGQLTMAWLIRWDEKNQPYPELATEVPTQANGGVSKDGLTITYHLRHGVKWSDGAPFDADDVVFSTHVVLNPANNEASRQGWDQIASIAEPDKYTVVYHMKKPYSPFIEVFFSTTGANPCILPKHLLGNLPNINNASYNAKPVGIGPFMVQSWQRQQRVTMVANPLYFRGTPKLHKIIYEIGADRNTLLSQLQAKELDMWPWVSGNYVARVKELQPYSVLEQASYLWDHIDFSLTNPILKDPIVRRAMFVAIDRQGLVEKIMHGLGMVTDSVTPATSPYNVDLPVTKYDPAAANAMLEKDGWKMGSDGIRAKSGQRLSFRFATYNGTPDNDNRNEILRSEWKAIGVEINVRHYPIALYFQPITEGGIVYDTSKWDITSFGWQNDAIGDYSQPYGCQSIPPNGQNDTHWVNAKACTAMTALYSHYEQEARNPDVAIVVTALANDNAAVVMDHRIDAFAYNKDLKNFHPNALSPFDNMMDVDI